MCLQNVYIFLKKYMERLFWKIKFYYSNFVICKFILYVELIVLSVHVLGEKPRILWETSEGCILSVAVKCT